MSIGRLYNRLRFAPLGLLAGIVLGLSVAARADERVSQVRDELQAHAVPAPTAGKICACIEQAAHEGLPCKVLTTRVCEGLVKQASPEALQEAVEKRAHALRQAHEILSRAACTCIRRSGERRGLCCLVAQALESGVPPAAFEGVFGRGKVCGALNLGAVVEAGEMLHLAGFDAATVRAFMLDCRVRRSNRQETLKRARARIEQQPAVRAEKADGQGSIQTLRGRKAMLPAVPGGGE